MSVDLFQVDAFTSQAFAGNPAAVCLLPAFREDRWLQNVAREMNLSETAFVVDAEEQFDLRWFTPLAEIDLCGHATLAAAHVLWESGGLAGTAPARFRTRSGLLVAEQRAGWITLDFPATPAKQVAAPPALARDLGVEPRWVGRSQFDYLVEVDSEEEVRRISPDLGALEGYPGRGIIVTSRAATAGFDFVSRFFAPSVGVAEDPVTGSSHCALGPYWAGKLGKRELRAFQASPRGGEIRVTVQDERVLLAGQAVTVFRGALIAG